MLKPGIFSARLQTMRDGLIPNLFPEGEQEGLYHTADATLWFFHALDRYVDVTGDHARLVLPKLLDIVERHLRGTHFGIRVDPQDGLLCQGQEGYQLTWMDAKVGDWVVTPRRGKAVEINALWYNALRLLEGCALNTTSRQRSGSQSTPHWPTSPSTTASGTLPAGTCTTSSTVSRAMTRPAGPIRSWPSPTPCRSGTSALAAGAQGRTAALAHACGPALAGA